MSPAPEPPPAAAPSWPDRRWVETFLESQAAEAGAARNTVLSYGRDLADFLSFAGHSGLRLLPAGFSMLMS